MADRIKNVDFSKEFPGRKRIGKKKVRSLKPPQNILNSFIVNALLKSEINNVKSAGNKSMKPLKHDARDMSKEDGIYQDGGYSTIKRVYGHVQSSSYADYRGLFSYLGRPNQRSRNGDSEWNSSGGIVDYEEGFELIKRETMERGARHAKYFAVGGDINRNSSMPIAGMNSAEWEQFKLWMILDPVMYRLKTSTS